MNEVLLKAQKAKQASLALAHLNSQTKNDFLIALSKALIDGTDMILRANAQDNHAATHLNASLKDRLTLNEKRIQAIASSLIELSQAQDPVHQILSETIRPNGLKIKKISVPRVAIAMI